MTDSPEGEKDGMSFLEHLEELRWHLVRSLLAVMAGAVLVFTQKHFVFDRIILAPANTDFLSYRMFCRIGREIPLMSGLCIDRLSFTLVNIGLASQFMIHLKTSILLGFILACPYVTWEIWRFVRPALYVKERRYTRGIVLYTASLFLTGVLFGYYIITPFTVNFLGGYAVSDQVRNTISLDSYLSTITSLALASGISFELPVAVYLLSKIGLLGPATMKRYRKHALIVNLFLSAIITPSPDVISQMLVAIPLYFLYEVSILISARVWKKKAT